MGGVSGSLLPSRVTAHIKVTVLTNQCSLELANYPEVSREMRPSLLHQSKTDKHYLEFK